MFDSTENLRAEAERYLGMAKSCTTNSVAEILVARAVDCFDRAGGPVIGRHQFNWRAFIIRSLARRRLTADE
jgi:hypothetical protein